MFRKVVLSTTVVILASSIALAAGGRPVERVRENDKNDGRGSPSSLERFDKFHEAAVAVDSVASRQALNVMAKEYPSVRRLADKIASLRLTKLGSSEGMKRLDAVLNRRLANLDVKTVDTNEKADQLMEEITLEALNVKPKELAECV